MPTGLKKPMHGGKPNHCASPQRQPPAQKGKKKEKPHWAQRSNIYIFANFEGTNKIKMVCMGEVRP